MTCPGDIAPWQLGQPRARNGRDGGGAAWPRQARRGACWPAPSAPAGPSGGAGTRRRGRCESAASEAACAHVIITTVEIDHTDLVLLLLGAPSSDPTQQGRINGITRLEKLAFLLEEESDFHRRAKIPTERLQFQPYHYGPYTKEIYDAVSFLVSIGLIKERRIDATSGLEVGEEYEGLDWADLGTGGAGDQPYVERRLELTDKGEKVAEILTDRVGADAVKVISGLKDRFGAMSLNQLLRYVYAARPDMAAASRIKDTL